MDLALARLEARSYEARRCVPVARDGFNDHDGVITALLQCSSAMKT